MMNILILKTDIKARRTVKCLEPVFNNHPGIVRWTIDTNDIDNVLRIEASEDLTEGDIVNLIKPYGLHCEDLPD